MTIMPPGEKIFMSLVVAFLLWAAFTALTTPAPAYGCSVSDAKKTLKPYLPRKGCRAFSIGKYKFEVCKI